MNLVNIAILLKEKLTFSQKGKTLAGDRILLENKDIVRLLSAGYLP